LDLDEINADEYFTDGENDAESLTDYDVAVKLDMLGSLSPKNVVQKSLSDMEKVKIALNLISKARSLQLKANLIFSSVALKCPSVNHFAELLTNTPILPPHVDIKPITPPHVDIKQNLPQHVDMSEPKIVPHKQIVNGATRFVCKLCGTHTGSWSGCDGHIRKTHSFLKYGPCPKCITFTTFNVDSFRTHFNNCK
jgi:hypothetical protein